MWTGGGGCADGVRGSEGGRGELVVGTCGWGLVGEGGMRPGREWVGECGLGIMRVG